MGFDNLFHYLNQTLEVLFVNLLLSGDNAVVIALACRSLPPHLTRRAMWIGIYGAIALRILLATVASFLLSIPLLKLVGGIALTAIAIKLTVERRAGTESAKSPRKNSPGLWSAVGTIIVADLVMSVDNVVALAAVAQGSLFILSMGLLMSVPLLLFGSLLVSALLGRYPLLKRAGGAMLGWLAGEIAISDPMIMDWVNQQAPALTVVVPILVVVFVLIESGIMEGAQATAYALRPKPRAKAAIIKSPPAAIEQAAPAAAVSAAPVAAVSAAPVAAVSAAPAAIPAAETAMRRQPKPAAAAPPVDGTTSHVRAPWHKRVKLSVWIATAVSIALLWILFRSLSLDFPATTPALQWTPPAGQR
jgi:YjbE family integral membrane protein